MNRNSGNVSKTKKLIPGTGTNSKHNRKSFQDLSDSSSISSNRNSTAHSDEEVRGTNAYTRAQVDKSPSCEEQEQLMKKLQCQVKELRHKLRILEESVDSKDYSLGTIAREKDRAIGEIKRLERSNKLLRQQLNDERNHYLEEKEKFCEEMTKYKRKLQETKSVTNPKKSTPTSKQSLINHSLKWNLNKEKGDFEDWNTRMDLRQSKSQTLKEKKSVRLSALSFSDCQIHRPSTIKSFHLYEGNDVSLQMAALRTENAKLRSIISERDERNYELCLRFLRMKHYKNDIKNRFQDLENEYLQVIANLMDKIDEARQEFNFIIDQKFKRPLHSTNAMYLQMVQRNSRMTFENASLRLENQCLKKELNKHVHVGSSDFERKNELAAAAAAVAVPEAPDPKSAPSEQKEDAKTKRNKKNVNFDEIRTIYERELKNSDTDSNYMSKTSTTVPSNGNLEGPKSDESILEGDKPQNGVQTPKFQMNSIPNEILQKIFKRIDSSSCQTLNSRSSKLSSPIGKAPKPIEAPEKSPIVIEQKSPFKVSSSSSPCDSKESIRFDPKEMSDSPRAKETKKETDRKQSWGLRNRIKSQVRRGFYFERDSEDVARSGGLNFPVKRFTLAGRNRLGRKEKIQQNQAPTKSRLRMQYIDSCGLQENVEFSDLEPTEDDPVTPLEMDKLGEKPEEKRTETETDEEGTGKTARRQAPAVGSRSRSSNKLNLQDELMEAWRHQSQSDESSWGKELKLQSVQSQTTAVKNDENLQCDVTEPGVPTQDGNENIQDPDGAQQRRSEGSKRFSHRLMSTSPEQLRNILTESQMGTFRTAPIIVGHATTEITPAISDPSEGLQLSATLISISRKPSGVPSENDNPKVRTRSSDTETPPSPLSPPEKQSPETSSPQPMKSPLQVDVCSSDLRLPVSSLPTSNSTMEIIDSAAFNRSHIMMRTLSAPGLLESNWLDPYTLCEMRDCGTNT